MALFSPSVLFTLNLFIHLFDQLAVHAAAAVPPMWYPKQCSSGNPATMLSLFGGRLGFTKGDYCNPTGNVLLFIQVLWLNASAHCISVLTFTLFDFFGLTFHCLAHAAVLSECRLNDPSDTDAYRLVIN